MAELKFLITSESPRIDLDHAKVSAMTANRIRYMAQSILTGFEQYRDGSYHGPILPLNQAQDVMEWSHASQVR